MRVLPGEVYFPLWILNVDNFTCYCKSFWMFSYFTLLSYSYDWFQTESSVTIAIYTKQKNISLDSVLVDLQGDSLRAETFIQDHSYLIHIGLSHEVQENFSVRVIENVGKVDIVLQKRENISWKCLGQPLEKHDSFIPKKDTGMQHSCFLYLFCKGFK